VVFARAKKNFGTLMSIVISEEPPDSPDARQLISELDVHLNSLPYPAESRHAFSVEKLLRDQVVFFVMRFDAEPVACCGLKFFGKEYAEVKRMYVREDSRGRGYGKAMLDHLATHALQHGISLLRLETGIYQVEAIGLYERYGFQCRSPFGEYKTDPMSVYFEKLI
jgi:putative acetyltransferase